LRRRAADCAISHFTVDAYQRKERGVNEKISTKPSPSFQRAATRTIRDL
jgi:hypothetical protein